MGRIPPVLSRIDIEELLQGYKNHFGKAKIKVHYVIKKFPRDVCDAENENTTEEEIRNPTLDDIDIDPGIEFRMDDKTVNLRLRYERKFKKITYIGGKHFFLMGLEVESFSYSVLMELVKDQLHFTEIGGIYANKGRKGGWKLLSNDKQVMALVKDCDPGYLVNFYTENIVNKQIDHAPQMQPHVITQSRENFIQETAEAKFITTHPLQHQQKKVDKKLPEVGNWQDISTKESEQDVSVNEKEKGTARRKLAL
ncbi:hypothetical protein AgCh_001095 [Apium graveolens]